MGWTFEELASRELDGLWHGALFLSAGDQHAAEQLLERALRHALASLRATGRPEHAQKWLEARLVGAFLETPAGPALEVGRWHWPWSARQKPSAPVEPRPDPRVTLLFDAARTIPADARAALWLVVFRRWKPDEAAGVLLVEPGAAHALLEQRVMLTHALVSGLPHSATSQ